MGTSARRPWFLRSQLVCSLPLLAYVTLHEWSEAVHSVLPPSVEGSTEGENDVVQPPRFFPEVDPDTFVTE